MTLIKYQSHSLGKSVVRLCTFPVYDVLDALDVHRPLDCSNMWSCSAAKLPICGIEVNVSSKRIRTFRINGVECRLCGLEACHFALECCSNDSYQLNLWGIMENGTEVLFTSDHIRPVSLGGKDWMPNRQTMCYLCNINRGNLTRPAEHQFVKETLERKRLTKKAKFDKLKSSSK